ncbi:MAG TPA: MFS transporter [Acidimicrobiales bacterium]|jgi:EmrB/QacA subfamily drug resistance transporter|nr:MFS transporter [Acidimicrobiales bacterium]
MDRKWWTLIAVCTGTFMLLLDITVVNVALPDIQRSLHSSFADLQWVVDAYALTLAAFLLTAGVLGDMFGRRRIFATGVTIFSVSSLLCGLSTSALELNLSRAAQGVGGAIMFATSLALIAQAFAGRERGTAFGVYGAVVGGAVAVGPLVGGAITSGIGWRWIFFINLPLGVMAVLICLSKVEDSRDPTVRRIDWIGFVTFSLSLFMLVYALVQGNAKGWSSPTIVGLLVGSGVLMAIFVAAEWLQRDPMLDLSLFRRPAMVGVSLAAFTLSASIFAMFLYLTLYLQEVLGYGPFAAGVRFLPLTMLAFLVAPVAGKLTVRVNARYLLGLGLLLVALGCNLMTRIHATSTWTVLLPGFIVAGIGVGITNPVLASATVSVVPAERSGMATGSSSTFRQVGISTGIAGLGAIFLSQIRTNTTSALATSAAGQSVLAHGDSRLSTAISGSGIRQAAASLPNVGARDALIGAYKVGFSSTFDHLMAIAAVIAFVGAVGSLVLVRQRDFVPSHSPGEGAGGPTGLTIGEEYGATAREAPPPRRPRHAHSKRRSRRRRRSSERTTARRARVSRAQPAPRSDSGAAAETA